MSRSALFLDIVSLVLVLGSGVLVDQAGRPRLLPRWMSDLGPARPGAAVLFAIVLRTAGGDPALRAAVGAYRGGGAVRQRGAVPAVRGGRADGGFLRRPGSSTRRRRCGPWSWPWPCGTRRAVTSWQAAGLIVGFAGAVLIFTPWHTAGGLFSAGGLECLAASISYAVSYIYMDRFLARRGIGPVVLSACQLAGCRGHARDRPGRYRRSRRRMSPPRASRRSRCWGSSGPGSRTC